MEVQSVITNSAQKELAYNFGVKGFAIDISSYINGLIDGDHADLLPRQLTTQQARYIGHRCAKNVFLQEYFLQYIEGAVWTRNRATISFLKEIEPDLTTRYINEFLLGMVTKDDKEFCLSQFN